MAQLQRGGKDILPPEYARTALVNAAGKNLTMYPISARDVIAAFREAVVERKKKIHGVSYAQVVPSKLSNQ